MRWTYLHPKPLEFPIETSEVLKILLENRGLTDTKAQNQFFNPDLSDLTYEEVGLSQTQAKKAFSRILKAIQHKESVVVYGDYDADGVCSTAIVWEQLHRMRAKVMPYLPHREKEGYGMSKIGLSEIQKQFNPTLIITVDHGIGAARYIDEAKDLNIDTIIIDHHTETSQKPNAFALLHSTKMSAAGLAWFLMGQLRIEEADNTGAVTDGIELAAIGLIADLVPLIGPSRTLTYHGISAVNNNPRPGLQSLILSAGLQTKKITSYEISHMIAPRINAMGRLTHAIDALRLLCTKNLVKATSLAGILSSTNRQRQNLTSSAVDSAITIVEESNLSKNENILVVGHESFSEGIIGLVAGRLTEKYQLPSVVFSFSQEGHVKASCRSIKGFDITAALASLSDILLSSGGHPMAAGLTMQKSNLELFKDRICQIARKSISEEMKIKEILIDVELPISAITDELLGICEKLEPFGVGNQKPAFACRAKVLSKRSVGKDGRHLQVLLSDSDTNSTIAGIAFGQSEKFKSIHEGDNAQFAYHLDKNEWNGRSQLQLQIIDGKLSGSPE